MNKKTEFSEKGNREDFDGHCLQERPLKAIFSIRSTTASINALRYININP